MVQILFLRLLALLGVATGTAVDADVREEVTSPRVAQVRLAEVIAEADAVVAVRAHDHAFTFSIVRDGQAIDVVATTRDNQVVAIAIAPAKPPAEATDISWLGEELGSVTAIVKLTADEDGAVTLTTNDGRRYMVIPGRGSGGNAAVEARWAGQWDTE